MELEYYFLCDDGLIIKKDGVTMELDQGEISDILACFCDGYCAICQREIPQGQQICCKCLAQVYLYHQNHHLCQEATG
jgi:hypothetical protein